MTQQSQTNCPFCGQAYSLTPEQTGQTVQCTKCGKPFTAGGVTPNYATPTPGGGAGNGMAVASLICGLIFCSGITGILAIIFGILGLKRAKEPAVGGRGRGMATAGIVLGALQLLIVPAIMLAILLPALNRAREMANRIKCASNMRQIGQAMLLYSNENGGNYPDSLDTLLKTQDITPAVFVCPAGNDTVASSAATLNSGGHESYIYLGKGHTSSDEPSVVELTEPISEHHDGSNCLFADGHVEFVSKSQLSQVAPQALAPGR